MSSFDEPKNYYVFKYVVDVGTGEPTDYEGEIQSFVKAINPWDAVEKAGLDDMGAYGANRIDDLDKFVTAIKDERKHLKKISKELKTLTDERDAEMEKYLEERPCPNGCGKMNEKFQCDQCGYGQEKEQLLDQLDEEIKRQKKAKKDTSELAKFRDLLEKSIKDDS